MNGAVERRPQLTIARKESESKRLVGHVVCGSRALRLPDEHIDVLTAPSFGHHLPVTQCFRAERAARLRLARHVDTVEFCTSVGSQAAVHREANEPMATGNVRKTTSPTNIKIITKIIHEKAKGQAGPLVLRYVDLFAPHIPRVVVLS